MARKQPKPTKREPGARVGDLVMLASGGPVMTVMEIMDDDHVTVSWFKESFLATETEINISALVRVNNS